MSDPCTVCGKQSDIDRAAQLQGGHLRIAGNTMLACSGACLRRLRQAAHTLQDRAPRIVAKILRDGSEKASHKARIDAARAAQR